jgi:hypothetical protein
MFSEFPQLADIVRSAFHHLANPLVLQTLTAQDRWIAPPWSERDDGVVPLLIWADAKDYAPGGRGDLVARGGKYGWCWGLS